LADIIEAADDIAAFVGGMGRESFLGLTSALTLPSLLSICLRSTIHVRSISVSATWAFVKAAFFIHAAGAGVRGG
jgi:hypothetical protein